MKKSLRVLAAATAMTMLMSTAAYAETLAKPGDWTEITTSDWSGNPVKVKVTMHTITETEFFEATTTGSYAGPEALSWGGQEYVESESGDALAYREAVQNNPGYTPYSVMVGDYNTAIQDEIGWQAKGYLSAFCVTGADVRDYHERVNIAEAQEVEGTFFASQRLLGWFTLNWNGVDYRCKVYKLQSELKNSCVYTVFLPNGYNGDVSLNYYPILWKGASYDQSSVQTLQGWSAAFANSTSADIANRIECYVTGSKVQPRPEGWRYEYALDAQGRYDRAVQQHKRYCSDCQ